ncbi:MAG: miaA [Segetibacter sp.]|nr:miaA [Segetibacter sp.]
MHSNTIIIVCGPTAVGKTAFAIDLARALQTDIISVDSRQCYKELGIGVAKPSPQELAAVRHYFINSHSIYDEVNAGVFEKYALDVVEHIFKKHATAVMVGGTGLYIKAFCEGMDEIPAVNLAIRQRVIGEYEENGLEYLQKKIAEKDPVFWKVAEQQNPQRLMRALEVLLSTGRSVTSFRKGHKVKRPFNIIKAGLELPRVKLYDQINNRVDKMMDDGLLNEVKNLYEKRTQNALQTVGYRELFDYLENKCSLSEAVEKIKTNSRQYAKRQLTWFKKDPEITWYDPREMPASSLVAGLNLE